MRLVIVLALVALALQVAPASADQRRDYMLAGTGSGDRLVLDYFGTGGQISFEHRRSFLSANDYALRAASLVGYPLAQVTGEASIRFTFFEISGTVGYRAIWRNLSFQPGDHGEYCKDCDRSARRHADPILGNGPDGDAFFFSEARIQLYAPMNDYVMFTSLFGARYEGVRPRSYDQFYTDIHDAGVIPRWEMFLFVKHRNWGGIGPYTQLQWLPRDGKHVPEFAYGFNAVTRLGLIPRNDLVFLTFLMRPNDPYYGQHSYFAPFRALLVYRITLSL